MSIKRSELRSNKSNFLKLSDNIKIESTGAVNINIPLFIKHVDFLPSSFKIYIDNKVIYIDPLIVDDQESADFILITHGHRDHFSKDDIKKLIKDDTVIISPQKVYKKLNKFVKEANNVKIKPGDEITFDNIMIESVEAYNVHTGFLIPHPEKNMNTGYIIDAFDKRIYHAGDTDYINEIEKLTDITVALIPIDGGNLTMSTKEAAEFVNNIKPEYVIPMHYDINNNEVDDFNEMVNSDINLSIMDGEN